MCMVTCFTMEQLDSLVSVLPIYSTLDCLLYAYTAALYLSTLAKCFYSCVSIIGVINCPNSRLRGIKSEPKLARSVWCWNTNSYVFRICLQALRRYPMFANESNGFNTSQSTINNPRVSGESGKGWDNVKGKSMRDGLEWWRSWSEGVDMR